jgi:hypothetical protein
MKRWVCFRLLKDGWHRGSYGVHTRVENLKYENPMSRRCMRSDSMPRTIPRLTSVDNG